MRGTLLKITDNLLGIFEIITEVMESPLQKYLKISNLCAQGHFYQGSGPSLNRIDWLLQAHARWK